MRIDLSHCAVRDWREGDLDRLVRLADNRKIWLTLRDRFPSPYTREAGKEWLAAVQAASPPTSFAIAVDDQLAGSIGVIPGTDIYARTAEVGYWLGEEYWGRGLAAEALTGFAPWVAQQFHLLRLWAAVFVNNPGSARVLEKAGFVRDATFKNAAVKDGRVMDEWIYSRTWPD